MEKQTLTVMLSRVRCDKEGGGYVPDHLLVVQVDIGRLGELLRAGPVAHLLVQELPGCFQLRLDFTFTERRRVTSQ